MEVETPEEPENSIEAVGFDLSAPVYPFSSDLLANTNTLKLIAQRSGGQFFNLAGLKLDTADLDMIVHSLGEPAFGFISADFDPRVISALYVHLYDSS